LESKAQVIGHDALLRMQAIHGLSLKYNQLVGKEHQRRLLELMRSHIGEIEELVRKKDGHFLIEIGDLLVLSFEMLIENDASVNNILLECFERYEKKLQGLLDEKVKKN